MSTIVSSTLFQAAVKAIAKCNVIEVSLMENSAEESEAFDAMLNAREQLAKAKT